MGGNAEKYIKWFFCFPWTNRFVGLLNLIRGGAYKTLARPTSLCHRTESIASLERGVCSCAEVFSCWVHHSWRFGHAEALREVGPEMPEHGSKSSTVPVVWTTFGIFSVRSKWFPVGRDWWPWTKPGYITMTRKQSNNQWNCGIGAHSTPELSPQFFWDQDSILLIHKLPKSQTINAEYYSSLLVQLKDILKEKSRWKVTKRVLFLHGNAQTYRAYATQKKLNYLGFQCLYHPP